MTVRVRMSRTEASDGGAAGVAGPRRIITAPVRLGQGHLLEGRSHPGAQVPVRRGQAEQVAQPQAVAGQADDRRQSGSRPSSTRRACQPSAASWSGTSRAGSAAAAASRAAPRRSSPGAAGSRVART